MRSAAFIAVLVCAAFTFVSEAAHADDARESRYGPAPERAPVPRADRGYVGVTYDGPSLGWSGKREVIAPQPQAQPVQQPWWAQQQVAPQPAPTYAPQARYQPQPEYPPQDQYQNPPPQYQPAQSRQPYAAVSRVQPQPAYDAPRAAAPVQTAYAEQSPPVYQQPRALQPGQVGVRTYSVGRQFGMNPDPIPAAGPPRMVLIAPPASPPDEEKARGDDGDWSSADQPNTNNTNKKDADR